VGWTLGHSVGPTPVLKSVEGKKLGQSGITSEKSAVAIRNRAGQ
jgi:hypothetical protein